MNNMQDLTNTNKSTVVLLCVLVLPWIITIGSNSLIETWMPGVITVEAWRNFSSGSFLLFGIIGVYFFLTASHSRQDKVLGILFVVAYCVLFAQMLQVRRMCGDEPAYIGELPSSKVASCE